MSLSSVTNRDQAATLRATITSMLESHRASMRESHQQRADAKIQELSQSFKMSSGPLTSSASGLGSSQKQQTGTTATFSEESLSLSSGSGSGKVESAATYTSALRMSSTNTKVDEGVQIDKMGPQFTIDMKARMEAAKAAFNRFTSTASAAPPVQQQTGQQAGIAMLTQANAPAQQALSLFA
ncbi:hypothetical protein [Candidatus Symbiobacter mobilis]|nr:hypothetical protein [Candidatus Symbiobacter mobilis]